MKKIILMASLIITSTMYAKNTGTVKGFIETDSFKVEKMGVETEVKVKDTGFSFGGTFQAKDLKLGNKENKANALNNSSVWAKYEIPKMNDVNTYVKATIKPKFIEKFGGNAELEGQLDYMVAKDVKIGLNSKTIFPFNGAKEDFLSKHKIFLDTANTKASVELAHTYTKDSIKYIEVKAESKYTEIDNLKLSVKGSFRYLFKDKKIEEFEVLLKQRKVNLYDIDHVESLVLDAKYTGIKNLELNGGVLLQSINYLRKDIIEIEDEESNKQCRLDNERMKNEQKEKIKKLEKERENLRIEIEKINSSVPKEDIKEYDEWIGSMKLAPDEDKYPELNEKVKEYSDKIYGLDFEIEVEKENEVLEIPCDMIKLVEIDKPINNLSFGVKLGAKYTGISNLILQANGVFGADLSPIVSGYVKLHMGTKYDYILNDKFKLSPEFNMIYIADNIVNKKSLELAPKLSTEYKLFENMLVNGSIELPIKVMDKSVSLKTTLNVEYNW